MLKKKILKLGEKLDIEIEGKRCRTKVLDFADGKSFVVYHPTVKSIPVKMEKGDTVRFSFFRNDGIYGFLAVLEELYSRGDMRLCRFTAISDIQKNQRRSSFRLPVLLEVWIQKTGPQSENDPGLAAIAVNLSDTGLLIGSKESFPDGQKLQITLKLEEYCTLVLDALVVRSESPAAKEEPYKVAVRFVDCPNSVHKRIVRYIMKQQVQMRKND